MRKWMERGVQTDGISGCPSHASEGRGPTEGLRRQSATRNWANICKRRRQNSRDPQNAQEFGAETQRQSSAEMGTAEAVCRNGFLRVPGGP
jgi:hypothetical protein